LPPLVQLEPLVALPVVLHFFVPLLQSHAPTVHSLPVGHGPVAVHDTQVPPEQTLPPFVEHAVPSVTGDVLVHVVVPVEQSVVPFWQSLPDA
jgi:hypothetical protein